MSLALYRKYRPATFAEVLGQDHVTVPLRQALRNGKVHHAYLFSGPRGCGKTSSARILARSLNCEQGPTPDPCGVCDSCVALAPNGPGSLDVVEIDAASHGGVDDARELRERAFYAPVSSRYKVYIIDEAHMVSREGFNALLKLVEEPPEFLRFVFATTEPEKVLQTIRSRTHHYPFRLMPRRDLTALLSSVVESEGIAVDDAVLPLVVRAAAGSARDGLSVLDQVLASAGPDGVSREAAAALLGVTPDTLLDDVVDAFAAADGAAVFAAVDSVMENGHDPRRFATDVLERLRDLIVLDAVPEAGDKGLLDCPPDQLDRMQRQAAALGTAGLSRAADLFHEGLVEMRGTTAPRLLLELICARVLLPAASSTGLLTRLERLERRFDIAAPVTGPPPVTPPHVPGPAHVEHPPSEHPGHHAPGVAGAGGAGGAAGAGVAGAAAGAAERPRFQRRGGVADGVPGDAVPAARAVDPGAPARAMPERPAARAVDPGAPGAGVAPGPDATGAPPVPGSRSTAVPSGSDAPPVPGSRPAAVPSRPEAPADPGSGPAAAASRREAPADPGSGPAAAPSGSDAPPAGSSPAEAPSRPDAAQVPGSRPAAAPSRPEAPATPGSRPAQAPSRPDAPAPAAPAAVDDVAATRSPGPVDQPAAGRAAPSPGSAASSDRDGRPTAARPAASGAGPAGASPGAPSAWPSTAAPGGGPARPASPPAAAAGPQAPVGAPTGGGNAQPAPIGLDAAALRRAWDDVLVAVKARKKTAHAQLNTAQVLGVDAGTVTLSFTHAPIMRQFQSSVGVDVLKEALTEVLGVALDVACVTGGGGAATATATHEPAPLHGGPPAYPEFAPGDEAVPDDPDDPQPESRYSGEDAALRLVQSELGGKVVGTIGDD